METDGEALQWLDFAREDLAYGGFGLERFPRAAAWSFQQAAEKALKACLVAKACVPPRTHDLVLLLNLLDPNSTGKLRSAILQLAEISAATRYPDDDADPVDVTLARSYEAAAKAVVLHAAQQLATK